MEKVINVSGLWKERSGQGTKGLTPIGDIVFSLYEDEHGYVQISANARIDGNCSEEQINKAFHDLGLSFPYFLDNLRKQL